MICRGFVHRDVKHENCLLVRPQPEPGPISAVISIVLEAPIPKRSFGDKTSLYVIYIYIYTYIYIYI